MFILQITGLINEKLLLWKRLSNPVLSKEVLASLVFDSVWQTVDVVTVD